MIIRVFFAIEFEDSIKEYLWERQQVLKENSIKGNFTSKDNFHLTLKFIGEVEPSQIENLKKAMDEVVKDRQKFKLILGKCGRFQRGKKSIVWIGLGKNEHLEKLYNDLEKALEVFGYLKEERRFKPHITIGREVILQCEFEKLQQIIEIVPKEIFVHKISLMESTRINGELMYKSLYVNELKI